VHGIRHAFLYNLSPPEHALLKVFLLGFMRSVASSLSQFSFSVYLGMQVDSSWDSLPDMMSAVLTQLNGSVDLTVIHYPLHPNFRDLV